MKIENTRTEISFQLQKQAEDKTQAIKQKLIGITKVTEQNLKEKSHTESELKRKGLSNVPNSKTVFGKGDIK